MHRLSFVLAALPFIALSSACGSSSSPTSPTSVVGYTLAGTVPAAIDGVPQAISHSFLLTADATVAVTLKSAVETLADGTTSSTVNLGVSLGTVVNGSCVPIADDFVNSAAGTTAQLTRTMSAGTDCVQISDVTVQEGPVAYSIAITY